MQIGLRKGPWLWVRMVVQIKMHPDSALFQHIRCCQEIDCVAVALLLLCLSNMFSPLLVYAVAFLLPVSAQQHDGQLPQITHAPNTMTTIPHREPSYSNLARPASLLVALEEHELRARSPSEIAAKVLHKRACHNVADVGKRPPSPGSSSKSLDLKS